MTAGQDNFFRPPNDGAYETDQLRTGPPLDYVAEKLRHNLEAVHSLISDLRKQHSADSPMHGAPSCPAPSETDEHLLATACYAFRMGMVSYLALNNLLALANEKDIDDRLLAYTREEFKSWLDRIDEAGSVTG